MSRLTHKRENGIKTGYWSPAKKEELVQRLAAYENTDLEPEEIVTCKDCAFSVFKQFQERWIQVTERLPEVNGRYLVTRGLNACGAIWNRVYIINYSDLMGLKSERIWWDGNVGKSDFKRIDDVIAWMPLPNPYERSE